VLQNRQRPVQRVSCLLDHHHRPGTCEGSLPRSPVRTGFPEV